MPRTNALKHWGCPVLNREAEMIVLLSCRPRSNIWSYEYNSPDLSEEF